MTRVQARARLRYAGQDKQSISELIELIFDEHEKDIERIKRHDRLMRDEAHKFNKTVKKLELICDELVNLPKGVESHSWSDYKAKR